MSDKEARALAAGDTIEVNGVEYRLRPVGMRQLHEVQRSAVDHYKREYLRTYSANMDLIPEEHRASMMERKLDEVARWDVGSLPTKIAHDVRSIPITPALIKWLENEHDDVPETESGKRAVVAAALDSGKLTVEVVREMTKERPARIKIPYDSWWVTATYEGMVAFIRASLQAGGSQVGRDDVMSWPLSKIMEAARKVEAVTAPSLGNT